MRTNIGYSELGSGGGVAWELVDELRWYGGLAFRLGASRQELGTSTLLDSKNLLPESLKRSSVVCIP